MLASSSGSSLGRITARIHLIRASRMPLATLNSTRTRNRRVLDSRTINRILARRPPILDKGPKIMDRPKIKIRGLLSMDRKRTTIASTRIKALVRSHKSMGKSLIEILGDNRVSGRTHNLTSRRLKASIKALDKGTKPDIKQALNSQ